MLALLAASLGAEGGGPPSWVEGFDRGRLDPTRWVVTAEGDFRERTVDVVDVGRRGRGDFRLRLRVDTRGTRDDTVKFLGVRTLDALLLRGSSFSLSVDLDWNDQANGSYLSAALILAAQATGGNPLSGPAWFKAEYVGVPPGRNARLVLALAVGGKERNLYDEGWPEHNRGGRRIGVQNVRIVSRVGSLQLWENGRLLYDSRGPVLPFDRAYLYLQLSSHSNYPPREVYFDDVRVRNGAAR